MRKVFLTVLLGAVYLASLAIGPGMGWAARTWFDERPANQPPPIQIHVLFWSWSLGLPESLAAQLADAKAANAKDTALAQASALAAQQRIDVITAKAAVDEAAAEAKIKTRTVTLIKEIHDVIPPEVDRRFPLPDGLIKLHDAAALGVDLPDPQSVGRPDDAASAVTASSLAQTIAGNYESCRLSATRLSGIQAAVAAFNAEVGASNASRSP